MSSTATTHEEIDLDAIRDLYRVERDKRVRSDGLGQYADAEEGDFAYYAEDPYTPREERESLTETVDVLVVGGGFGGLLTGARLRQAGVQSLRILDRAGDFGGTWYWNRYPGAQCDIESYLYLPLLEQMGFMPSEKYVRQPEIHEYTQKLARHFRLYEAALFQTVVTDATWLESENRWRIETDRGDVIDARFVVMANGLLSRPRLPGIPGITDFKGHTFHSSRWDYGYTGGTTLGGLDKLGDKKVGIIGTGATAVQIVPHLAQGAEHLYVFQRTPSVISFRGNRPTDPSWAESLKPGWQEERLDNFMSIASGGAPEEDLVDDGWTTAFKALPSLISDSKISPEEAEKRDYFEMERMRERIASVVSDSETAAKLKPYYRFFCKRPCFHDEYLPTFNRDNVSLIDTDGRGVERITETGVVVGGVEYELDCLVFATGFESAEVSPRQAGFDPIGRGGLALSQKWNTEVRTLFGLQTNGFPNLFFLGITQGTLCPNFSNMLNEQSKQVAFVIEQCISGEHVVVEPTLEGEADWVATMEAANAEDSEFWDTCTPSRYNDDGDSTRKLPNRYQTQYGGGPKEFYEILAAWRAEGTGKGLTFR
ncbi:MAG: NAD(P)/FAD-dependent oxidoreductase [Cryobacterium sp.]|nr:NAD(P)/FAD-dependent oxidoreductase [Cryobacterium sp.]